MTAATIPHIVFLHQRFPCSGAEQVTIDVANHLSIRSCRVTVLTADHRPTDYHVGQERLFSVELLPAGSTKWSPRVARAVRDYVVQRQVSVLVTYRELLYARWLKRQTGVNLVYELHNTPGYEYIGSQSSGVLSQWFYMRKYQRVYAWADAYGVLCEGYRQMLAGQLSLNPTDNKLWVLPNSIAPAARVVFPKEKIIVYVGRLTHRDKRVDRLLRIWQQVQHQLADWQLLIVGSGKAAPQLTVLAEELRLERYSFEGHATNVQAYYDRAAVLCLTSSFEGWPMVVAEAQASGVVPVLFDSFAAAHDLVATPDEGILVPPFDEQAFARQLVALCTDDARLSHIQQSVVRKAATYSIERSGAAWEALLRKLKIEN